VTKNRETWAPRQLLDSDQKDGSSIPKPQPPISLNEKQTKNAASIREIDVGKEQGARTLGGQGTHFESKKAPREILYCRKVSICGETVLMQYRQNKHHPG